VVVAGDAPKAGKPSSRQYLVVGGVTLAGGLAYFWWKKRQAATPAAADTSGTAPSTTTGTPAPKPKPGPKVAVPGVVGQQYEAAAKAITGAGLEPHRAEPDVGKVTSQLPKAGAKVAHGSVVVLSGKGGK
jgi:LPXTG-motif cell wall-anchored protein